MPAPRRVEGPPPLNRETRTALAFLVVLVVVATVGFSSIEGWPLLDGLYMTVITISTVGYGEPRPLSPAGKLFTTAVILVGVGTLAYIATKTSETLLDPTRLRFRKRRREIRRMRDHVIVCGYGRMGAAVADVLRSVGAATVVIDSDPALAERLDDSGVVHLVGDATDDAVLNEAEIRQARALASVLPHDADNLFVTLTARELNPEMTIIARSSHAKNDGRMTAAGATRVLNPYRNGGRLMAQQLLQPSVTEFIDLVTRAGATDLRMEEVQLQRGSTLDGIPLREAPLRKDLNVIVVGVRREGEGLIFNPPPELAPRRGDVLIVLGRGESLRRLAQMAAGGAAR